jgi:lipid-A-disaccharide synthase-like uncharacterized protein
MRNVQIGLIVDFSKLIFWWESISSGELLWLSLGLGAQAMFSTRFIIQWIASERAKKSIVPEAFWYFSFVGGFSSGRSRQAFLF